MGLRDLSVKTRLLYRLNNDIDRVREGYIVEFSPSKDWVYLGSTSICQCVEDMGWLLTRNITIVELLSN